MNLREEFREFLGTIAECCLYSAFLILILIRSAISAATWTKLRDRLLRRPNKQTAD